jgi:hypothetical protein
VQSDGIRLGGPQKLDIVARDSKTGFDQCRHRRRSRSDTQTTKGVSDNFNLFAMPGHAQPCLVPAVVPFPYAGNDNREKRIARQKVKINASKWSTAQTVKQPVILPELFPPHFIGTESNTSRQTGEMMFIFLTSPPYRKLSCQ